MKRTADWPCQAGCPARGSDPVTSHIAAETVQKTGTRSRQKNRVLQLVHRYPGRTACELAAHSELDSSRHAEDPLDRYQINRRTADLEAENLICKGQARKSRVNGHLALTWHPVLPVPAAPKEPTLF